MKTCESVGCKRKAVTTAYLHGNPLYPFAICQECADEIKMKEPNLPAHDIQSTTFARINADGSCWFDWEKIAELSAQWRPYKTNLDICVSRLLTAARATDERTDANE